MNRLDTSTGSLCWFEHGSGTDTPLLMIHSLGASSTMWSEQLSRLSETRRLIAVDLPGHGGSSANPGSYTIDELGSDALAVATAAGFGRFDVCGVSLGGLIAFWLAINAADRISTLIACNTAPRIGSPRLWSDRIAAVGDGGMEAIRQTVVPRFVSPGFALRHPEKYAEMNRVFAATNPVGYTGCCAALRDADLTGQLGQIHCPTLIVGGENDIATPPEQSIILQARIPGSRVAILPAAAHLANIEQPQAFNQVVLDVLQRSTPAMTELE